MDKSKVIEDEIRRFVGYADFERGKKINPDNVLTKHYDKETKKYTFLVRSEENFRTYVTRVYMSDLGTINKLECSCPRFESMGYCKHIVACLLKYKNEIFKYYGSFGDELIHEKSKLLLNSVASLFKDSNVIKKKVNIVIDYNLVNYYGLRYEMKARIGVDKLYSIGAKITGFYHSVLAGEEYKFTKSFTYDPNTMYITDKDIELLRMLYDARNYGDFRFNDEQLKILFRNYSDHIYSSNSPVSIVDSFPLKCNLTKDKDYYELSFDSDDYMIFLTDDGEYIGSSHVIYHLNKNERKIIGLLAENDFEPLKFDEKDMAVFQNGLLRGIKSNINIDENIDLQISKEPTVKFFFDIDKDNYNVECIPKFYYDDNEISYFENNTKVNNVLRDVDFENNTVLILSNYNFTKGKDRYFIEDLDDAVDFIENGIDEIARKYSVFTSEKIKNINLIKKSNVSATFSIGKDNILSYDFSLDGVDKDEINILLSTLKNKKKYYRLKSGDIMSLDDTGLDELASLKEDLETDDNDGVIPKYRALYLDSVCESKYDIIKTDGMFDEFIKNFKEYKNAKLTFAKDEAFLRDYQEDGVRWLYTIYKCGFGGILADEMGLGKSLQTLIFFRKVLKEKPDAKFLIIAPTSLVYNWENEVNKWTSEITYEVLAGNKNIRKNLIKESDKTLFITSYATLREDVDEYSDKHFEVMIIDEAQNIKNAKAGITKSVKKIDSNARFALTGTPIENSIVELWSIFDFVMPGFLSSMKKFQEKYHFSDFDDKANDTLSHLKRQVRPFILRRKKSDVTKELPPKIENNIYVDLTDDEKKIYAGAVNDAKSEMDRLIKNGGFQKSKMMILALLTRLRQLCIDPHIVFENYKGESSKINSLMDLIKELTDNGHKILLFTSFRTALDIVKKNLDLNGISSFTIAGDVPSKRRQELVNAFNKDNTSVFLIMLKSGGTGLNLTSADTVIHLDPWWNPQAENQATDRTHRIGQKKTVTVIKLICCGTIEEKIIDLQLKKKKLSDAIIEGNMDDNTIINNLSEIDIRNLLSYTNKD